MADTSNHLNSPDSGNSAVGPSTTTVMLSMATTAVTFILAVIFTGASFHDVHTSAMVVGAAVLGSVMGVLSNTMDHNLLRVSDASQRPADKNGVVYLVLRTTVGVALGVCAAYAVFAYSRSDIFLAVSAAFVAGYLLKPPAIR